MVASVHLFNYLETLQGLPIYNIKGENRMNIESILTNAKQILCALLLIIVSFAGIGVPETGAKSPAEDTVRIMSFNVRNVEYDRGRIVPQVIADYLPDSVGVQECEGIWFLTLKSNLPSYGIVGVGRDAGLPLIGESTAILYRKDKYKLVDWGTFWLSETPDKVSMGWDAKYKRTCTWAILENKETKMQYAHVNTHLDNAGKEARTKGLQLVMDKAASFDMPVVVTGDFNFPKGSDLYKQLTSGNLTDSSVIAEVADSGCTSHGYKDVVAGNPIDFVLVNERITEVKSYNIIRDKIDGKFISDHYPIYSDIIM